MSISTASVLDKITPPATHEISAKAKQMSAAGTDVISLSIGEPHFNTPQHIKQAACQAIQDDHSHYTAVDGIAKLKQSICKQLQQHNQLNYQTDQVMVCNGAKQALYNLFAACLNPGDEVLIPAPYWVSYPDMVSLCHAKPVIIKADISQQFKITAAQLAAAITKQSKLLILNSPNNPSGMIYSDTELSALAAVIADHPQLCVISDDIYDYITWQEHNKPCHNILNVCPQLADRCVIVNGLSKSFAMTGWRIGYAAGPSQLIAAMKKVQGQTTSGINHMSQYAAIAALEQSKQEIETMRIAYHANYILLFDALQKMPLIKCIPSQGAFYILIEVTAAMQHYNCHSDIELADKLLSEAHVATVPGSAFGLAGYLRLSFAVQQPRLELAISRLTKYLQPSNNS